jgi:hypothetical protein
MAGLVAPTADSPLDLRQVLEAELDALDKPPGSVPSDWPSAVHRAHAARPAALCISGGGIRSATFALGVIQGLAARRALGAFDYLSTVSGGGYVGGWLSAWIHRADGDLSRVTRALNSHPSTESAAVEPEPVAHLRRYSNYMSPRWGLLSADLWTLITTYLRNLLLTWVVLVPLSIAGVAVFLTVVNVATLRSELVVTSLLAFLFLMIMIAIGFFSVCVPWRARSDQGNATVFVYGLAPLLIGLFAGGLLLAIRAFVDGEQSAFDAFAPGSVTLRLALITGCVGVLGYIGGWITRAEGARQRSWRGRIFDLTLLAIGPAAGIAVGVWAVVQLQGVVFYVADAIAPAAAIDRCGPWLTWPVCDWLAGAAGTDLAARLFVIFAPPVLGLSMMVVVGILIGALSSCVDDMLEPEWWARFGGRMATFGLAWSGASALVLLAPVLVVWAPVVLPLVAGLTPTTVGLGFGSATAAAGATSPSGVRKWWDGLTRALAPLVAVLLIVVIAAVGGAAVVTATSAFVGPWASAIVAVAAFAAALGASYVIDVNRFSLHAVYRHRLIRAYLRASRPWDSARNAFTNLDADDDLALHAMARREPGQPPRVVRPLHVVNVALNLLSSSRLLWQQRKAESFTMTALHAGSFDVGYRPMRQDTPAGTRYFGGGDGLSLGTAVAISGAAASPNMGYNSSSLVTMLMAVFNVRLGWWLGNPRRGSWHRAYPAPWMRAMVDELTGSTNELAEFVYLSDGGHFENLGLYEMVQRRCHTIVVLDAGQDPNYAFESLGGAIRKIRIDFGIPILFPDGIPIHKPGSTSAHSRRCAIGEIHYAAIDGPDAPTGRLVFVKPAILGDEPADVAEYHKAHHDFPQQTTADQFFDEDQFESYRTLGVHTVQRIWGADDPSSADPAALAEWVYERAREHADRPNSGD